MGGLLHLVQQEGPGWTAALPSPLLAVPNALCSDKAMPFMFSCITLRKSNQFE